MKKFLTGCLHPLIYSSVFGFVLGGMVVFTNSVNAELMGGRFLGNRRNNLPNFSQSFPQSPAGTQYTPSASPVNSSNSQNEYVGIQQRESTETSQPVSTKKSTRPAASEEIAMVQNENEQPTAKSVAVAESLRKAALWEKASRDFRSSSDAKCFWFTDWNDAIRAADVLGRPLLVHFSMNGCVPCRNMEQNVFSQETIQALAGSYFVMVKVNGEVNTTVRDQFGVTGYPSDYIVQQGKIVASHTGFQNSAAYSAFLTEGAKKAALSPMTHPVEQNWKQVLVSYRKKQKAEQKVTVEPEMTAALEVPALEAEPSSRPENVTETKSLELAESAPLELAESEPLDLLQLDETPAQKTVLEVAMKSASFNTEVEVVEPSTELGVPEAEPGEVEPSEAVVKEETAKPLMEEEAENLETEKQMELETNIEEYDLLALDVPENAHKAEEDAHPVSQNNDAVQKSLTPETNALPILLDGFSPVTMVEKNAWAKGSSEFFSVYKNGQYYFASEEEKAKFDQNPDFYALVSDGFDIVLLTDRHEKVYGTRRFGIRYGEQNFVFISEESREIFRNNPDFYAAQVKETIARENSEETTH